MLEGSSSLGIWAERLGCLVEDGSQGDTEGAMGTCIVLAIAPTLCRPQLLGTELLWTEEKAKLAERSKWSS